MARVTLNLACCVFTTLPWPVAELAKTRMLVGHDYCRYGIAENEREITAMTRYAHEQGLTARKMLPQDLFAASTFELVKL